MPPARVVRFCGSTNATPPATRAVSMPCPKYSRLDAVGSSRSTSARPACDPYRSVLVNPLVSCRIPCPQTATCPAVLSSAGRTKSKCVISPRLLDPAGRVLAVIIEDLAERLWPFHLVANEARGEDAEKVLAARAIGVSHCIRHVLRRQLAAVGEPHHREVAARMHPGTL